VICWRGSRRSTRTENVVGYPVHSDKYQFRLEFKESDANGFEILFEGDVNNENSNRPQSADNEQDKSQGASEESLAKNLRERPTSSSVPTVPWSEVAPGHGNGLRPFIVTTANLESAVSASDYGQPRIEAEEIWLVRATGREDAISVIWKFLKANIASVDAFDVAEMHALARAAQKLCSSEENSVVKIATPWCAEVAFAE
jgi:hypothetical protein